MWVESRAQVGNWPQTRQRIRCGQITPDDIGPQCWETTGSFQKNHVIGFKYFKYFKSSGDRMEEGKSRSQEIWRETTIKSHTLLGESLEIQDPGQKWWILRISCESRVSSIYGLTGCWVWAKSRRWVWLLDVWPDFHCMTAWNTGDAFKAQSDMWAQFVLHILERLRE